VSGQASDFPRACRNWRKSRGFALLAASLLLEMTLICWRPKPLLAKNQTYGEWIVTSIDRGHILSSVSCLDLQCVIFAETHIACLIVTGNHHNFSMIITFPKKYGEGYKKIVERAATVTLITPDNEKHLTPIRAKINVAYDDATFVSLSDIQTMINVLGALPDGTNDVLRMDAGWPLHVEIPLDGFSSGFNDLRSRCGEGWRLP
jgi:hypothetical protein